MIDIFFKFYILFDLFLIEEGMGDSNLSKDYKLF